MNNTNTIVTNNTTCNNTNQEVRQLVEEIYELRDCLTNLLKDEDEPKARLRKISHFYEDFIDEKIDKLYDDYGLDDEQVCELLNPPIIRKDDEIDPDLVLEDYIVFAVKVLEDDLRRTSNDLVLEEESTDELPCDNLPDFEYCLNELLARYGDTI